MSFNNHARDTSKPQPVVEMPSYPTAQMPCIPVKIRTSHMTTPAANEPQFQAPTFRSTDPRPPVTVGVPHHSAAPSYEQGNDKPGTPQTSSSSSSSSLTTSSCGTKGRPSTSQSTSSTDSTSRPPASVRGPTTKHTTLPRSSPAATTYRGAPILGRSGSRPPVMSNTDRPVFNYSRPSSGGME